jgi:proteasome lid subunit RPN8/RPN11
MNDGKKLVMVALAAITFGFCAAVAVGSTEDYVKTLPVSGVDAGQVGAETMDDAAKAGVSAAIAADTMTEYAGSVYTVGGKFFYTKVVSQKKDGGVDYRIQMPVGAKLVAIFHTHPSTDHGAEPKQFSKSDVNTAQKMGLVMYVGVIEDKTMIQYDPSRDHPHFGAFEMFSNFYGGHTIKLEG